MAWYDGLKPRRVMEIFDDISRIPRGTGNMKAISEAVCSWIRGMGLRAEIDEYRNVKAFKPATPGRENAPGIMFATHMDMVCSKDPGVRHDFLKDPIDIRLVDGDTITANGTTLGADDGMGMAFVLAILESNDIPHPAIEAIFTTDEETDMSGCLNLDFSGFRSKLVISLDGDPIGIAGAGEIDALEHFRYGAEGISKGFSTYRIDVSGLLGGHSGMEATKERANAAMYLNRVLMELEKDIRLQLVDFESGFGKDGRSTAFAYCAHAVVAMDSACLKKAQATIDRALADYRKELELRDPGISVSIAKVDCSLKNALDEKSRDKLHDVLCALPDGIFTQNLERKGLMDSSVNTGVVYLEDGSVWFQTTIRSALASRKRYLFERISRICGALDVEVEKMCDLPQWDMNVPDSIMELAHRIYPDCNEIVEEGTSECGVFCDRMPGVGVIALECPYSGAHSTKEQISARACEKYFKRLVEFIGEIKG